MGDVKYKGPLRWRLFGVLIILISLFLGFYLKMLFIQKNREKQNQRIDQVPAAMQREADSLNKALGNLP